MAADGGDGTACGQRQTEQSTVSTQASSLWRTRACDDSLHVVWELVGINSRSVRTAIAGAPHAVPARVNPLHCGPLVLPLPCRVLAVVPTDAGAMVCSTQRNKRQRSDERAKATRHHASQLATGP